MARNYGTRGGTDDMRVNWDRFGEIVIERWQAKLIDKGIYDTGTLHNSIEYGYRATNALNQVIGRGHAAEVKAGTIPDSFTFAFPLYGIYVERGVGRGYTRGNGGDLVKFKGKERGRKRRTWSYAVFVNERHKLGELVGELYGRSAQHTVHSMLVKTIGTPKEHWK